MQINLDPTKWLIAIAGLVNDWIFSRQWSQIFLYSIPGFILIGLATAVFTGGLLNKTALRDRYIQLGQAEMERWQAQLGQVGLKDVANKEMDAASPEPSQPSEAADKSEPDVASTADASATKSENTSDSTQLSPYAEMLFRRAHLLEPSSETQFVIGATLWQRGVIPSAKQTLQKIAPANARGFAPAHAILAKICRDEFAKTRQPALIDEFQNHAKWAVEWKHTFPEVLLEQTNLLWQKRKFEESLNYLQQATKSHPDFYVLLVERAKAAGQNVIAQVTRKEAIAHFEAELEKDPKSEKTRILLAQLQVLEPDGDQAAETTLMEGLSKLTSSKVLARALSEVYRIRFTRSLEKGKTEKVDLNLLERALQIDPTNPEIAQTVAAMLNNGIQANDQLGEELNRVLASGQATMATHAILSEYRLQKGDLNAAKTHLEQVYKMAPMSVKYANNLAYIYAKERRLADAEKTAVQTLALIQANGAQREPFVDELLDTLGMIYQAQDKSTEAISAYEACIKLNPKRIETRGRLVTLYRKTGNEGVAKAHEETIKAIEKASAEAKAQDEAEKKALEALAAEKTTVKSDSTEAKTPQSTSEPPASPSPEETTKEEPSK